MGFLLRPQHKHQTCYEGWIKIDNYYEIISSIEINISDLGFVGNQLSTNEIKDAYSIFYSVPNPWSAAFLYDYFIYNNNESLNTEIIKNILSVVYEYIILGKLSLTKICELNCSQKFKTLFRLAPDFIKYNNCLYFLKDDKNKIIAGLSKRTLVWVSQAYSPVDFNKLENDIDLVSFLKKIRDIKFAPSENDEYRARFWGSRVLTNLLESKIPKELELRTPECPEEPWTSRINVDIGEINDDVIYCMIDNKIDKKIIIFTKNNVDRKTKVFKDKELPEGFYEKIKELKKGDELPLNQGKIKWILIDEYLKNIKGIRLVKLENLWDKDENIKYFDAVDKYGNFKYGFLFPFSEELIKYIDLNKVKFNNINKSDGEFSKTFSVELYYDNKFISYISGEFIEDKRSIHIWPPFESEIIKKYFVFEYERDGDLSNKELKFFKLSGNEIPAESKYYKDLKFRIYILKEFPEVINVIFKYGNKDYSGLIKINPKQKNQQTERSVKVGFDFGTSHTTVVYKSDDMEEPDALVISSSSPIVLTDNAELIIINNDYLPAGFLTSPPRTRNEFNKYFVWYPILSMWRKFDTNVQEVFLRDGVAAFLPISEEKHLQNIEKDLKWGLGGGFRTRYRDLYLNFLLTLVLTELEAKGFNSVEIFWSYPMAFSDSEFQDINRFWSEANIIVKKNI